MLKFKTDEEKTLFLMEVERFDLLETLSTPDELFEDFIKKRFNLVKKLKNFRKSQNSKRIWSRHRFSMLKGVRKWHKSLKGKKFHRQLGRFLATRITENDHQMIVERYETLKALSSLRTHIYIEGEYYRPSVDDDVEFELLFEYAIPLLSSLELKLLESRFDEITPDEEEIVLRLAGEDEIIEPISEMTNRTKDDLTLMAKSYDINEDLTYGLTCKYHKVINNDEQVKLLMELMEVNEI